MPSKNMGKRLIPPSSAKVPNIILREGAEPIVISGLANVGNESTTLKFPTLERQRAGWASQEARLIVACYGDRYVLLKGGCNC